MQTKRIYQVQHWLYGQWIREHNWCKVEAFSKKEAAEKVCGVALTDLDKLAQLRARVLTHDGSPWLGSRLAAYLKIIGLREVLLEFGTFLPCQPR